MSKKEQIKRKERELIAARYYLNKNEYKETVGLLKAVESLLKLFGY